ncbi:MAG: DUF523 domain-containing protein [Mobilitalea sp.]
MYLISSCLAGVQCRYDGKGYVDKTVMEIVNRGEAILVCPEVLAGLPTPRPRCERREYKANNQDENKNDLSDAQTNKEGEGITENQIRIICEDGRDLSKEFQLGAQKVLAIAKEADVTLAILKSKSPSCGKGVIYDGSFTGTMTEGNGVTAELLLQNGIKVITEKELTANNFS